MSGSVTGMVLPMMIALTFAPLMRKSSTWSFLLALLAALSAGFSPAAGAVNASTFFWIAVRLLSFNPPSMLISGACTLIDLITILSDRIDPGATARLALPTLIAVGAL